MIQGMMDLLQQGYAMRLIDDSLPLEQALDEDVAVLLLSHVNYRTGAMHDMAAVTLRHTVMAPSPSGTWPTPPGRYRSTSMPARPTLPWAVLINT
jgi:hypothetical protein